MRSPRAELHNARTSGKPMAPVRLHNIFMTISGLLCCTATM